MTSDFAADEVACERFRLAERRLQDAQEPVDVAMLRGILSGTHLEFETPAVLSSICDLRMGDIHVYYFNDFERSVTFNLERELAVGPHGFLLADVFPDKPYVATVY